MTEKKELSIPKDKLVQIYFKTGTTIEGVVVVWYDDYAVLQAPGGANNVIVYKPSENILMVKIINAPAERKQVNGEVVEHIRNGQYYEPEIIEEEDLEADSRPLRPVQQKLKQTKQERINIAKRLREPPKNLAPQKARYSTPWSV